MKSPSPHGRPGTTRAGGPPASRTPGAPPAPAPSALGGDATRPPAPRRFPVLPTTLGALLRFGAFFLVVSAVMRTVLTVREWAEVGDDDLGLLGAFARGAAGDLDVTAWALVPLLVFLTLAPRQLLASAFMRWAGGTVLFLGVWLVYFDQVAEWVFWEEFQARFNFIAVDYLVYTHEVVGNIRESYPMGWILSGITLAATATFLGLQRLRRRERSLLSRKASLAGLGGALAIALTAGAFVEPAHTQDRNRYLDEIGKAGLQSLWAAFQNPILRYGDFYRTLPEEKAFARVNDLLAAKGGEKESADPREIARVFPPHEPARRSNVVLITVESLSAKFLGCFGSDEGLTPELDALAAKGLLFRNIYASGCRTVRGLEALALSVPPTPGRSIVKREDNGGLDSLGWIFREKGYDTRFLYGGYGYFDDMNRFFGTNGFDIVDRTDLEDDEVSFATIWGVCDHDLYGEVLRRCDESYANGRPFLNFVMTTSNHRPYTFPPVIDAPQKERASAVKYTDFAIGEFIDAARAKPWFSNTLFVIVADHCAGSAGRREIDLAKYHIPLILYGPGLVEPGEVNRLGGQIDIPPTLLALLGSGYTAQFYGHDLLGGGEGTAMVGNYQSLGLFDGHRLAILKTRREVALYDVDVDLELHPRAAADDDPLVEDTIAYYQTASSLFLSGGLRRPGILLAPAVH